MLSGSPARSRIAAQGRTSSLEDCHAPRSSRTQRMSPDTCLSRQRSSSGASPGRPVTTGRSASRTSSPTGTGIEPPLALPLREAGIISLPCANWHVVDAQTDDLREPRPGRGQHQHQPEQVAVPAARGVDVAGSGQQRADLGVGQYLVFAGDGIRLLRLVARCLQAVPDTSGSAGPRSALCSS